MNAAEMMSQFRELIGNPTKESLSNVTLQLHLAAALDWAAQELKYLIKEEAYSIGLVAGTFEYELPNDLLYLIWISWDDKRLTPSSQYRWDRDSLNFRDTTSSSPSEYAVQGSSLLLLPAPSADAITTDGYLKLRYIASPSALEAGGPLGLSDGDQWLVLYKAAIRYLRARPTEENRARMEGYSEEVAELMKTAKARSFNANETYGPSFRPVTGRTGGAR